MLKPWKIIKCMQCPGIACMFALSLYSTTSIGKAGNTKEESITVPLTSSLTGLDYSVLQIVNCHTADSQPVKQEVNGTVILSPLVFPGYSNGLP